MIGSITLVETCAGSLDQVAAKVLWTSAAINNSIVIGVDIANTFAEAGVPKSPFTPLLINLFVNEINLVILTNLKFKIKQSCLFTVDYRVF